MPLNPSQMMPSLLDYLETDMDWAETVVGIWPVNAPQGSPAPWMAFRLDSNEREWANDGAERLRMPVVEFTLASESYKEAHGLADKLLELLDRYKGAMGDVIIVDILYLDSRDGEIRDEVLKLFTVICEVSVWYTSA